MSYFGANPQVSPTQLPPVLHGILLVGAIGLAFWWLQIPDIGYYSLQMFALSVVIYFVLKRIGRSKLWHVLPAHTSLEMIVATFAFLLLIGSTGNLNSPFYALSYIHLFLLVFSSGYKTSSIATGLIMLFHVSLTPGETLELIGSIASLPIVFFFFLFAKSQYEEVIRERQIIAEDEITVEQLQRKATELETFLGDFAQRKLMQLKTLAQDPTINKQAILGQISLLEIEIERKISQLRITQRAQEKANDEL